MSKFSNYAASAVGFTAALGVRLAQQSRKEQINNHAGEFGAALAEKNWKGAATAFLRGTSLVIQNVRDEERYNGLMEASSNAFAKARG